MEKVFFAITWIAVNSFLFIVIFFFKTIENDYFLFILYDADILSKSISLFFLIIRLGWESNNYFSN